MSEFRSIKAVAIATSVLFLPGLARAQSLPAPGQDETNWRQAVSFYLFTPIRTTGTSTVAGRSASLDLNLGDVLDVLDFAAAGRYEAWTGDFGIVLDANYVGIEQDTTLSGPLGSAINVEVRQKWFGILAAYRVGDGSYGAKNQRYSIDLQGGLRYNSIRQEIDITTSRLENPSVLGGDQDWIEPVVGVRGMWRLNQKWSGIASVELGGFGAGGNDLQVGANVGFDFQPWEQTALTFGYRYFSVDYSDTLSSGEFAYDVDQHGPYFGVKYFFQ